MRHLAKGPWVSGALAQMIQSNGEAARIARRFTVHACTDITGFGLAGHCLEMSGSEVGLELHINEVPVMEGATECLHSLGVTSSLHAANKQASGLPGLNPAAEILFDPQTSGGLLLIVPAGEADELVSALSHAGYSQAAIVGAATDVPGVHVVT